MLHYILQIIAFQLFFLIIYDVFLRKETFFNWNRAYLLVTAVLSIVLPFIQIQRFKDVVPKDFIMAMPEVAIGSMLEVDANLAAEIVTTEASKFQFSWELIFYIGAFIALAIFMVKLIRIVVLIYKNPKYWNHNLRIVTLLKSNTAFSFFYYVFLGEQITEQDKPAILKHEAVHVSQKHTLDLLFFEILRILFWFNPLIYIYQSRTSSLHEFIADAEAVKSQNKNQYYQDLLSQFFETDNVSFINAFYKKSLIKKRIAMLSKTKSKQIQLIKYALLIPMVFGMLLYTSSYAQDRNNIGSVNAIAEVQEVNNKKEQETINQDPIEVPFAKIDEIPMFSTCENSGTQNQRRDCVANEISTHVQKNFNIKLAEDLNLVGKQRISVIFKIDTNGNVVGVRSRAPHPDLETEAIRVINTLPKFIPGKHEGEKVTVPYSLPIIFEINETPNAIINQLTAENSNSKKDVEKQELTEVPFGVIDKVPSYLECEKLIDQKEQRKCVADRVSKFVLKNFNTKLAKELKLKGRQRISVVFKIDTLGNITGIRSRAPHPNLKEEAERVIGLLPKMIPGSHEGKKMIVPYSLPIVFEVKDNSVPFAKVDKVPFFSECESLSSNEEQRDCVANLISKSVQKSFNVDLPSKLGLKGKQRIMSKFTINSEGNIVDIIVKAPHPDLEAEAIRTIKLLPKFVSGEHEGKKVSVSYSLPIVFMVAN